MLGIAVILTACGNNDTNSNENQHVEGEKLEVYTTIFPLEDFSRRIGGEFVNVTNLVPVGADAHTFEPTARDMINVADGDLFIFNGAGLEGFVDALLKTLDDTNVSVVEASASIDLITMEHGDEEDHGSDHDHGHSHDHDPHVWLDPILAIQLAESIKDAMAERMPEQEELFVNNFNELRSELENIDQEFQTMVEEAKHNTFVVSHEGYGYWHERYGLEQIGISGMSPTNEPSQRQLQEIIELAKTDHIKYILIEQNIPTKVADVVKNAIGAEGLMLHNLESLTEEDVQNNEDYSKLMRKNIESLRIALN